MKNNNDSLILFQKFMNDLYWEKLLPLRLRKPIITTKTRTNGKGRITQIQRKSRYFIGRTNDFLSIFGIFYKGKRLTLFEFDNVKEYKSVEEFLLAVLEHLKNRNKEDSSLARVIRHFLKFG